MNAGRITDGSNGNVATDMYHRYKVIYIHTHKYYIY